MDTMDWGGLERSQWEGGRRSSLDREDPENLRGGPAHRAHTSCHPQATGPKARVHGEQADGAQTWPGPRTAAGKGRRKPPRPSGLLNGWQALALLPASAPPDGARVAPWRDAGVRQEGE